MSIMNEKNQCVVLGLLNLLFGIFILISTLLTYLNQDTYILDHLYLNILKDFIVGFVLLIVGIVGITLKKYMIFLILSIIIGVIVYFLHLA